jgi:hypothetical protein
LGSCPETSFPLRPSVEYTNTIREDSTAYYLDYNGTDMNITYLFKKFTGNASGPWSPLSDAAWNYTAYYNGQVIRMEHPSNLNPTFWFTNGSETKEYLVGAYFGRIYRNITVQTLSNNALIIAVNYTLVNKTSTWEYLDSELITYNITIKGKTVDVHIQGTNGKWGYSSTINSQGSIPIKPFDFDNSTYHTEGNQQVIIVNDLLFFNMGYIWDKSDTSKMSKQDTTVSNSTTLNYKIRSDYYNLTDGTRNIVNDTLSITLSNKILDTTLNSKYSKLASYETLKNKWFVLLNSPYNTSLWIQVQRLNNYGMDMSRSIIMSGQVGLQKPDFSNYSFPNTKANVYQSAMNISSIGGNMIAGIAFQDINVLSPFYNNTNYNGIFINATNYSFIMKATNESNIISYNNQYAARFDRRIEIYNFLKQNLSDWGMNNYMYIDTEGGNTVSGTILDMDANSSIRGRQSAQMPYRTTLFNQIRSDGRAVLTENFKRLWTVGVIDAGDGHLISEGNSSLMGIYPDWVDTVMNPKQVVYSSRIAYFMNGWNISDTTYVVKYNETRDNFDYDKRIVVGIVQKERPLLDSYISQQYAIPDNKTILQYFSMDKVTLLKYAAEIVNRSYVNTSSGKYESGDEWAIVSGDFRNVQIFEEWSNGLRIYANLNRTGWWNLSINGAMRNLPPNGLYAYITNDSSFEECFNCDNTSTWVRTSEYIYLYPKNAQEITFSFPYNWYSGYSFYGDDSTNGRRLEFTLTEKSTYKTANPSILYKMTSPVEEIPWYDFNPWPHQAFWLAISIIILLWIIGISLFNWITNK